MGGGAKTGGCELFGKGGKDSSGLRGRANVGREVPFSLKKKKKRAHTTARTRGGVGKSLIKELDVKKNLRQNKKKKSVGAHQ